VVCLRETLLQDTTFTDVATRYNSNIWITWLDFLYQKLQSIPIWLSRKHVDATMPASSGGNLGGAGGGRPPPSPTFTENDEFSEILT
jgi:hypothetical protein